MGTGPATQHAVSPAQLKLSAYEVRRILAELEKKENAHGC
jgi:hypothetical protein